MNNDVYARRMNVESVISVIKRRFDGVNFNRAHAYKIKKQNSKMYYTTLQSHTNILG